MQIPGKVCIALVDVTEALFEICTGEWRSVIDWYDLAAAQSTHKSTALVVVLLRRLPLGGECRGFSLFIAAAIPGAPDYPPDRRIGDSVQLPTHLSQNTLKQAVWENNLIRRSLTTLLIVSYLATGLARLPHAHASQPSDHDARAHVHFDWFARLLVLFAGQAEDHGSHGNDDPQRGHNHCQHQHHGDDHHHGDDGHGHLHTTPNDAPVDSAKPVPVSDPDHDSTCVYVADDPHVFVPSGIVDDQSRVIAQVAILDVVVETVVIAVLIRPEWAHGPPDSLAAPRDLYLKLRTLRI